MFLMQFDVVENLSTRSMHSAYAMTNVLANAHAPYTGSPSHLFFCMGSQQEESGIIISTLKDDVGMMSRKL